MLVPWHPLLRGLTVQELLLFLFSQVDMCWSGRTSTGQTDIYHLFCFWTGDTFTGKIQYNHLILKDLGQTVKQLQFSAQISVIGYVTYTWKYESNNKSNILHTNLAMNKNKHYCLQATFGVRLPVIQGGTFSFLASTIAILKSPKWE